MEMFDSCLNVCGSNKTHLDKFKDECAVMGVIGHAEASKLCYLGLYSLQHRGQEGAGIVSTDGAMTYSHRAMGLVADVFDGDVLNQLKGSLAIGHARYATFGAKNWQNLQPLMATFLDNSFAIAHNGNLINASEVRAELEKGGAIFSTSSDSEVVLHLVARATKEETISAKLRKALASVQGAYSLVVLTKNSLIGVRDPAGVRPLSLGKLNDAYVIASETCAFDLLGAEFVRDIEPGEILEISQGGKLTSTRCENEMQPSLCVFEHIYFARPDSVIGGRSVYMVRKRLGMELSRETSVSADFVIPVPDSGVPAALGYAEASNLPFEFGLIRNHYIGRTFIEPKQSIRDFGVKIKLNANSEVLCGKRVVVVDDSIVRGTTCKKIVKILRDAGAKEVHFRISSPPTIRSCYYGIDTPSEHELIAANYSVNEIQNYIGADSLAYLSLDGMYRAVSSKAGFCDACFSGNYPLGKATQNKMSCAACCVSSTVKGGN